MKILFHINIGFVFLLDISFSFRLQESKYNQYSVFPRFKVGISDMCTIGFWDSQKRNEEPQYVVDAQPETSITRLNRF
jgi:hypothetical protein